MKKSAITSGSTQYISNQESPLNNMTLMKTVVGQTKAMLHSGHQIMNN